MAVKYALYRLMAAMIVAGILASSGPLPVQAAPAEKPERGIASPQTLPRGFEQGIAQLREEIKSWESRVTAAAADLAQTQKELDNLQVTVASVKATIVLQRISLLQVEELIESYADYEKEFKGKLKDLGQEIDTLKKGQQEQLESQNALRVQLGIIQSRDPAMVTPELQQASLTYLTLAGEKDRLQTQVLDQLEQRRRLLEQEQELVNGLKPQLMKLEADLKSQLLKRPAATESFRDQVAQTWQSLAGIPRRGWDWLNELWGSGRLSAFIWTHLASIFGLLGFILLLGWSIRRLNEVLTRSFQTWWERSADVHLLPLYVLVSALLANLLGLRLILWLGLFFWTFNLMGSAPAHLILAALITLWAVRLSVQWVQGFFPGKVAGGVLTLDQDVARFYRRSLKLFLVYLGLGFFGLRCATLLNVPESSRLFMEHFFLLGILVWGLWLLRRTYLNRLLPQLSAPTWLQHPRASLLARGLVLFLFLATILAGLLGFQNLAMYLAGAAAWTLLALVILWFLWLMGETIILHLLHPEGGRATYYFPERAELIQRVYVFSRWALGIILGIAVVLWSLNVWGITPRQVAWAFQWTTWGPSIGPARLTVLNVGGTVLAIYLGFFLSRVVRGLMLIRIFPRTVLDTGVQYTITTTVHYVILILAGLIALNILGFPLTNLALVAGALGVGIGFGLQNIVNNFLSGLILLFERPIKVGDMLVIDGQWGLVKEIRVRSTIFETFDKYVLIIPNSELVSNKVLNWTHYGAGVNRLTLKVGVAYGSDVEQVRQLLLEICQANPRVVAEPPPQVYFTVYGDNSLDFTIWVHVSMPGDRMPATHEINRAIFEAFNERGIEIPFPQRDLHIKEWPEALLKKPED
jgi:potassium-dependent mechanosensitive channel